MVAPVLLPGAVSALAAVVVPVPALCACSGHDGLAEPSPSLAAALACGPWGFAAGAAAEWQKRQVQGRSRRWTAATWRPPTLAAAAAGPPPFVPSPWPERKTDKERKKRKRLARE